MASNLDLLSDPYFMTRPLALVEADDWATQTGHLGEINYYRTIDGWDEILDGEFACSYRARPAQILELDICQTSDCEVDVIRALLLSNSTLDQNIVDNTTSYYEEGHGIVFRMSSVSRTCSLMVAERDDNYVLMLIRG